KRLAQALEIVDLAVEGDPDGTVFIRERLFAGSQVDNAEPTVGEGNAAAAKRAVFIGPAVDQPGADALQHFHGRPSAAQVQDPGDAAHVESPCRGYFGDRSLAEPNGVPERSTVGNVH